MTGAIVATTDFSARADRAIDRALMLGAQWGAPVALMHAVNRPREEVDQAALDAQMESVLPAGFAGADDVEFVYAEGAPPRALAQAAEGLGAALIVMGPARYNSIGDYILGTAVDYALRHCYQPILVVKRRPHGPYRSIVVATDFAKPSGAALRLALDWFPEADLHLVHACLIPPDAWRGDLTIHDSLVAAARARMGEFIEELGLAPDQQERLMRHVVTGTTPDAVNRIIEEGRANLVAIGSHGESGLRHATIGSMANILLKSTAVDTLMVTSRD